MEVNRIIIWTNPVAPFQRIYVMKDGVLVDQMGIMPNNIVDIVYALSDKYNITELHFSGTPSFAQNFADEIEKDQYTHYGQKRFTISFV
mgnify:CR=1 FL=1